ncbi:MAG: PfkB family carbohydrate kinase [Myxococcota bacterium]
MQPIPTVTMNPVLDVFTTVDRVVPGDKLRCGAPRVDPGGGGAGDSFTAALTAALARGDDLREALRLAVAVGSAALLTPGTALCRPRDAMRLLDRVDVRTI